ncbi:peptidoglycan DD-metalloendopeptidase family protein [Aidingimonas lacisalsi]|uniref:peptidoglycan DD-metalloendopeptidase family protein n=1 Tax=Aidingimonas lacisalsi TaxID=2604086 RepID=UPI0011D17DA3|nr:peptidoglycan DD-metalloendopeptidase family protein [Aidingimonas lacisalsi]
MRKTLLVSAVALSMVGCAAQQDGNSRAQIRDLSVSRDASPASTHTVEPGDTLYGIAWRHDMDFRELARRNGLSPPYHIEPGQTLQLTPGGGADGQASADSATGGTSASAGVSGAAEAQREGANPDWLAPDEEAIERNRRLEALPRGDVDDSGTRNEALGSAAVAGGSEAPGPIFEYDTPGADGSLSERDREERAARLARQEQAASEESRASSQEAERDETELNESRSDESSDDTTSSSTSGDTERTEVANNDEGTSVAGEDDDTRESGQRTYTPVDEVPWQWPADGELTGRFEDDSSLTAGIDIGGQKGQPVKAAGPGIVVYAGDGVRGYGNLILLKHNDEFLSAYAHNDSLQVGENDVVEAGDVIARMGDTDADEVMLHFEVRQNGQPQDPLDFLPSR